MILKQFQKVDGLKAVVKLPIPMAAVQIEERFSIVNDEDGSILHGEAYDYLMEGLKGELYVCRRDVFEACYKYVEGAHPHAINWNTMSELGLIEQINRQVLHPLGLAMSRDPDTGSSHQIYLAEDGKWEYAAGIKSSILPPHELKAKIAGLIAAACGVSP